MIHRRWISGKDGLHKRHPLADRHRCQVHPVGHIANGIDRWHSRLAVFIHLNLAATTDADADILQPHIAAGWVPARGKYHHVKFVFMARGGFHPDRPGVRPIRPRHFQYVCAQMQVNAILDHLFRDQTPRLIIKTAQDLRAAVIL